MPESLNSPDIPHGPVGGVGPDNPPGVVGECDTAGRPPMDEPLRVYKRDYKHPSQKTSKKISSTQSKIGTNNAYKNTTSVNVDKPSKNEKSGGTITTT